MLHPQMSRAYQQVKVTTSSPVQLIAELYAEAIRALEQAEDALRRQNIPEKAHYLGHAGNVVNTLLDALNFEQGGDIAVNLKKVYLSVLKDITRVNQHNDLVLLKNPIRCLKEIQRGWTEGVLKKPQGTAL